MTCGCKDKKPYTIESIHDVDVDDIATVPDYFIGTRVVKAPDSGTPIETPVKIPGARVMPTGNLANVTALEANNDSLAIPEGQVRAGYIDVQPGGNIVRLADATHPAQFLIVGNYTNGKVLVQTTGFLTIPAGHQYIVGTQYYTADDGMPSTDSASGQKLFTPLSDIVLNVNGDF